MRYVMYYVTCACVLMSYTVVASTRSDTQLHTAIYNDDKQSVYQMLALQWDINARDHCGKSALHYAVESENIPIMCALMQREDINLNARDNEGSTPLHWAAAFAKNPRTIEMLVCDLRTVILVYDEWQQSPIHWAAFNSQANCIRILAASALHIGVNDKSAKGETPLHIAALHGNITAIKELIENGADVTISTQRHTPDVSTTLTCLDDQQEGLHYTLTDHTASQSNQANTPLMYAISEGHIDAIHVLLQAHNVYLPVEKENTHELLHIAARENDAYAIQVLLQWHGLQVNTRDALGETPLLLAIWYKNREAMRALFSYGASLNCADIDGDTPLSIGLLHDSPAFAMITREALQPYGINLEESTCDVHDTPLHIIAQHGKAKHCDHFVNQHEFDVDIQGRDDQTPLHRAIIYRNLGVTHTLVKHHHALCEICDNRGETPLSVALRNGYTPEISILLHNYYHVNVSISHEEIRESSIAHIIAEKCDSGYDLITRLYSVHGMPVDTLDISGRTPLHRAALLGNKDNIRALVACGATISPSDEDGNTPFDLAVDNNQGEAALTLLKEDNVRVDVSGFDIVDQPLHRLAEQGNVDAMDIMVTRYKYDVNAVDEDRNTSLHIAVVSAFQEVVDYLLQKHQTHVDPKNDNEETPLHIASKLGYVGIVLQLLKHNADASLENEDGQRPIDLAYEEEWQEVVNTLNNYSRDGQN